MQKLTMEILKECFESAKKMNNGIVVIYIEMEGYDDIETIINTRKNFDKKLAYYKKAYNDDLTLKANKGIRIVGFDICDRYEIKTEDYEKKIINKRIMQKRMIPLDENMELILSCAVRYGIGRRTYITSVIHDTIKPLISDISTYILISIKNDIKDADDLGMDCDEYHWKALYDAIEQELIKRKNAPCK